ncbi:MAG TPA: histidine kinase [Candidatus Limnocylindrales bacterium]|nr:histidine kinase [Candidatus Limnocylindrales bacterium]
MALVVALRASGDALLAVTLTVLVGIELVAVGSGGDIAEPSEAAAMSAVGLATALLFTGSLAWRRRLPLVPPALAVLATLTAVGGPFDSSIAFVVALIVATYSVGASVGAGTRDPDALVGAVGVAVLAIVAVVSDPGSIDQPSDLALPVLVVGGPWLAGVAIRTRRDREAVLVEEAAALARERDARARVAVAAERARIARELHDVVAHSISVIVLQARGARHALLADPAAAGDALDTIEATATGALGEMRRVVDVLRADDEAAPLAPQPSLRDLGALLDQVRQAGLAVTLDVVGTPIDLSAGVDLSAYRIVQEALTNILRHAGPATARVVVGYGPTELELEITDTGSDGGAAGGNVEVGSGHLGMRERVALYGGTLDAAPRDGGGFSVRASLPIEAAPS